MLGVLPQKIIKVIIDKEEIYLKLMEKYPQLTPEMIATMNPYIQGVLARGPKIITLDTYEDYLKYSQSRMQNG